jgi:hypothetical protein
LIKHHGWIVVLTITFAVWTPVIWNDFVEWDDLNMIVQNPRLNPPTWAGTGWYWIHPAWNLYQPLTTTLWAALARIGWVDIPDQFGGHMNPAVFHFASIVLHTAAAVVLYAILRRALKNNWAAIAGALLFAVHPIQVEAVAFIGVINNPLAGFLGLLAIWQYLIVTDPNTPARSRTLLWAIGSIALILSLLAKPVAVVIPPIAFAFDWAVHRRPISKSIRSIVPWLLIILPCAIATRMIQHGPRASTGSVWYRPWVAADAVSFYVHKLIWPISLAIDYGRTPQMVQSLGTDWIHLLIPAGLICTALLFVRRAPLVTAGIFIFFIALLPNSGLVPFDYQMMSTVADRYMYFAMIGIALIVGLAVKHNSRMGFAFILAALAMIVLTQKQIAVWRNGETLFRHALAVNPNSWMSDNNLAVSIGDRSPDEAIELAHRAIQLRPDLPDAWNTLGSLLMQKGDHLTAIDAFRHAHDITPGNMIFAANLSHAENENRPQKPASKSPSK